MKVRVLVWPLFKSEVPWEEEERVELALAQEWNTLCAPPNMEDNHRVIFDADKDGEKYVRFKELVRQRAGSLIQDFVEFTHVKYSRNELRASELLEMHPDRTKSPVLEEAAHQFLDRCGVCGYPGVCIQTGPLHLDAGLSGADCAWTIPTVDIPDPTICDVVISSRLKMWLENLPVTGVNLLPIYVGEVGMKVRQSKSTFQLDIKAKMASIVCPPTKLTLDEMCSICRKHRSLKAGYEDEHGIWRPSCLYFPRDTWPGTDIACFHWPDHHYGRSLIVTQRVFRLFSEQKLRGCTFEPAQLVDEPKGTVILSA